MSVLRSYGHRLPQPHGEYRVESDDVREPQLRPGTAMEDNGMRASTA